MYIWVSQSTPDNAGLPNSFGLSLWGPDCHEGTVYFYANYTCENNYQMHDLHPLIVFTIHWTLQSCISFQWSHRLFHNSNDWEANLSEDDIKEYWVQSGTLLILNSTACCHINWKNPRHVIEFCSLYNIVESLLVSSRPRYQCVPTCTKPSQAAMIMWKSFVLRLEGLQIMFESGRHKHGPLF